MNSLKDLLLLNKLSIRLNIKLVGMKKAAS